MRKILAALAMLAASVMLNVADAQNYPSRPISLVVPFAAGGPTDTIARIFADRLRQSLGQTVVVENTTGAAGTIGTGRVVRAAPDGYTVLIGHWSTHVVNGAIYSLQYDVLNDFEPVALLTSNSQMIAGRKGLPANDLKEFIAWLKANPDKATAGTAGVGSPQHVFGVMFQKATGTRFQFSHYRGGVLATQDLMAGQIDLVIADLVTALPQIRGGTVKGFAFTGTSRLPAAPGVPTADEAGLPGFHTSVWNAIWAPKGTPKDIVARLNAAIVEAFADPAMRARLTDLGQQPVPPDQHSPEVLRALHKAEIEKWWPIIKAANIRSE